MIDLDFAAERAIRAAICAAIQHPEPPTVRRTAAEWEEYWRGQFHAEKPPMEFKAVVPWRQPRYERRRRPWYLRECIRWRPVIVPLQRIARWLMC